MNSLSKRIMSVAIASATALGSTTSISALAQTSDINSLTIQPGMTQSSIYVTWYAKGTVATVSPQVKIGDVIVDASVRDTTIPTGMMEENEPYAGYVICSAELTDLEPETVYTYMLSNDGGSSWSNQYNYTTPKSYSFKFAFTSDPQIKENGSTNDGGWNSADGTNQTGWAVMMETVAKSGATLMVSAGDQVEDQSWGKKSEYDAFFAPEEMATIAYAPAVGNHDRHYMFRDHFTLPNEMETSAEDIGSDDVLTEVKTTFRGQNSGTSLSHGNYTDATEQEIEEGKIEKNVQVNSEGKFDYIERREMETEGNYYYLYNNVLFVTLNTGAYPGGNDDENATNPQVSSAVKDNSEAEAIVENFRKTMQSAVDDYEGQYEWIIVTHHKSTQTVAKHTADSDIENYVDAGFEKLMSDFDVDFVLGGHDHVYSRSYVLDGDGQRMSERLDMINDPEGTIYLTGNCASDMQYYTPFSALDKSNNEDYPVLANGETGSQAYLKGLTAENPQDYLPIGNQEYNQEFSPSYAIFDVNGDTISVEVFNLDGDSTAPVSKKIDAFTVTKNKDGGEKSEGFENGNTTIDITQLSRYDSGMTNADGGVMEIVDYNYQTGWAYAINGQTGTLTAISLKDEEVKTNVDLLDGNDIDVKSLVEDYNFVYGDMTSVSISPDGENLAVALQAEGYNDNGRVAIFKCNSDGTLSFIRTIETGVQPDMVTYTDDGKYILTANEGEPRNGYENDAEDPKGTVTIINTDDDTAVNVGFDDFDHDTLASAGVVLKKGSEPSEDLEPEYISCNGNMAYISLQEANAMAVLDIEAKEFKGVYPLGTVDYSSVDIDLNKNDNEEDREYSPDNYENVLGLRMPDGISTYSVDGQTYVVTANEGDSREWGDYSNEDEGKLTSVTGVETEKKVTYLNTDDYDGVEVDNTYLFGSRSFSVFKVTENSLELVYDSASDFESKTAQYLPEYFNCSNDSLDIDGRSAKKGPEPETVTTGVVGDKTYAFVTLERTGGIMIYDITTPSQIKYSNYINSRDFSVETGVDDSPEGLKFVKSNDEDKAKLIAACEVGGTVAVYGLDAVKDDDTNTDEDNTSSSDGSGGGKAAHTIKVNNVSNGKISVSAVNAASGRKITVTVKPDKDYELESITVKDIKGEIIDVMEISDLTVSFIMPNSNVTIDAVFSKSELTEETPDISDVPFSDINKNSWYYDTVKYVYENNIMNGVNDNQFMPGLEVTRGMIVTMIYRLEGSPKQNGGVSFDDVKDGSYYSNAVIWASINNIVDGYDEMNFGPDDTVTREQLAVILYRYANYKGVDVTAKGDLSVFSDYTNISEYADTALSWACGTKIITGNDDNTIRPKNGTTRAEAAAMIMRFEELN